MTLPLSNIRVLDFTHLLPGELCSTILADLGCEVIRVETIKPGLAQRLPPVVKGESLYYWSLHRNKKRIALNLKDEKATEIVHKLVKETDIVIENFRPGVMGRLGIGYGKLHTINKGLLYCSISGYGQTSSYSQRPGHDLNFVAESGVLNMTTQADGRPIVSGVLVADYMSAVYGALSIVTGLMERQKTGKGRHLDISMFHCALSSLNILSTTFLYTGKEQPEGSPTYRHGLANYNVYLCKDGRYLAVASLEPQFWETFCQKIGREDLIARHPNGPDLGMKEILSEIILTKPLSEWREIFEDSNCCVSPVNTLEEALQCKATQEANVINYMQHPTLGPVPQVMTPVPFHLAENEIAVPGDRSLETSEILAKLGYSKKEIEALAQERVIDSKVSV